MRVEKPIIGMKIPTNVVLGDGKRLYDTSYVPLFDDNQYFEKSTKVVVAGKKYYISWTKDNSKTTLTKLRFTEKNGTKWYASTQPVLVNVPEQVSGVIKLGKDGIPFSESKKWMKNMQDGWMLNSIDGYSWMTANPRQSEALRSGYIKFRTPSEKTTVKVSCKVSVTKDAGRALVAVSTTLPTISRTTMMERTVPITKGQAQFLTGLEKADFSAELAPDTDYYLIFAYANEYVSAGDLNNYADDDREFYIYSIEFNAVEESAAATGPVVDWDKLKTGSYVEIPEGVTKIPDHALEGGKFKTLKIPDSLVEIGEYAFYKASLPDVMNFKNVKKIGANAFRAAATYTLAHRTSNGKAVYQYWNFPCVEKIGDTAFAYSSCYQMTWGSDNKRINVSNIAKNALESHSCYSDYSSYSGYSYECAITYVYSTMEKAAPTGPQKDFGACGENLSRRSWRYDNSRSRYACYSTEAAYVYYR